MISIGRRHAPIALTMATAALAVPAPAHAVEAYWSCTVASGQHCWESNQYKYWAYVRASRPTATSSLCAWLTNGDLSFYAAGSGCYPNTSRVSVCFSPPNGTWRAMVGHLTSGKTMTVDGYADTARCH